MSTRAQIAFYPSEDAPLDSPGTVYLYQHSDGYPEGVLPVLLPFARSFAQHRGLDDTAYATARCLVALAQAQGTSGEEAYYLGLGADTVLHPDISFFYHVSPTRVGVYRVVRDAKNRPAFRLLRAIALAPSVSPQIPARPTEAR